MSQRHCDMICNKILGAVCIYSSQRPPDVWVTGCRIYDLNKCGITVFKMGFCPLQVLCSISISSISRCRNSQIHGSAGSLASLQVSHTFHSGLDSHSARPDQPHLSGCACPGTSLILILPCSLGSLVWPWAYVVV